jgi:hypothetical protein
MLFALTSFDIDTVSLQCLDGGAWILTALHSHLESRLGAWAPSEQSPRHVPSVIEEKMLHDPDRLAMCLVVVAVCCLLGCGADGCSADFSAYAREDGCQDSDAE